MIRILLVDDHTIFRSGLKRLLSDEADIRVEKEAGNGAEALTLLRQQQFDVIILDINMEGRCGLSVLESIRIDFPKLPVLILSMYPEEQYALEALKAGANGYASKDIDANDLVDAIRQVAAGKRYLTQHAAQLMLMQINNNDDRPAHRKLAAREYEIMLMIVSGMSLTDIGEKIFISVKTVSTYRSRILAKLGVATNAELVRYALRHGIIN
jgi:two-component system, NarL family, invasion response regulator UvrY